MTQPLLPDSPFPPPARPDGDFHDTLAQTLEKAPYLLVSLALHGLAALLLAGLAFLRPEPEAAVEIRMAVAPPPPEIVEPPPPPPESAQPETEEPVLVEADLPEDPEPLLAEDDAPDFAAGPDLRAETFAPIGLGPGGGGGGVRAGRPHGRGGGSPTEKAVAAALKWLHDHQAPEGFWDCDEFMY
ncbi:MAG: hypothetical protein D6702_03475, partial [Planctomycetota bacterium]